MSTSELTELQRASQAVYDRTRAARGRGPGFVDELRPVTVGTDLDAEELLVRGRAVAHRVVDAILTGRNGEIDAIAQTWISGVLTGAVHAEQRQRESVQTTGPDGAIPLGSGCLSPDGSKERMPAAASSRRSPRSPRRLLRALTLPVPVPVGVWIAAMVLLFVQGVQGLIS